MILLYLCVKSHFQVQFAIGKTGVFPFKHKKINRNLTATWKYKGTDIASLGSRWSATYAKEEYWALVPVTCISTHCIPDDVYPYRKIPERYALDLEEDLYDYFRTNPVTDCIFNNPEQYNQGRRTAGPLGFFSLYVAFKLILKVEEGDYSATENDEDL